MRQPSIGDYVYYHYVAKHPRTKKSDPVSRHTDPASRLVCTKERIIKIVEPGDFIITDAGKHSKDLRWLVRHSTKPTPGRWSWDPGAKLIVPGPRPLHQDEAFYQKLLARGQPYWGRSWGADTAATQLTSITTEQFFDQTPTAGAQHEFFHVQIDVDFPASPTDNLIVAVYGTLDDATENWDDTAFMEFEIDNGTDPNAVSFNIAGLYRFRIGVRRSGTTDTITSADMSFREKTTAA